MAKKRSLRWKPSSSMMKLLTTKLRVGQFDVVSFFFF
jgi:hypothetical protein